MTTDPGDLVLDPTCGSGTTAYVAEQWGRRWITIDTSRVALALARQRLLTAKFDYFELRELNDDDRRRNPAGPWLKTESGSIATLDCETVPHVTLKSIAQNSALDAIFARHQPGLDAALVALNAEVGKVGKDLRQKLAAKLAAKQKAEGKRAITEADRRRWLLPPANRDPKIKLTVDAAFPGWYEWEAPFDTDPDWPEALQTALTAYRTAWRAKMDDVNAAIAANADNEELVDKPRIRKNVVRVSGPFTMEAVMPSELTLDEPSPMAGADEDLDGFAAESVADAPQNTEAFLDKMLRLLAADGVRFPNNKVAVFSRLSPMGEEFLHAEGEWELPSPPAPLPPAGEGSKASVAVSIGPEFGPVTAWQVENALFYAARRGFDNLVFAGFSFDAAAQATIQDDPNPRVRCHLAHIRPDVNMGNLLKDTPNAQLFSVFGSPRVALNPADDSLFTVTLEGVDIYNPVENTILATKVDKVAAWFVDTDYDGRVFCITQAFFPDKSAWEKLAKALKSVVDESAFEALSGTESLPFAAGQHQRVAVKVIDPRGNEVMRVLRLEGQATMARNSTSHPDPTPQGGRESYRKKAADPAQQEIPIQPVSKPILCSPYLEPDRHWVYDTQTGDAREEAGRRPASYWYRTQRTGSTQRSLLAEEERDDLPLVNLLREDVRRWRDSNYRNATPVTRQLLAHWGRTDRPRRLFFCQQEAVETIIYLNEILASGHKTGFAPRLSPQDYHALLAGLRPSFITESEPRVFPTLSDPPNASIT